MLIKVCGMRDCANIRAVGELPIDLLGLIFAPSSPRFVEQGNSKAYLVAKAIMDSGKKCVGVFRNAPQSDVVARVEHYSLDYIQLHGDESADYIAQVKDTISKGIKVIKVLNVANIGDIKRSADYEGVADMLLFDTKCDSGGGSGKKFSWQVLDAYDGNLPFLLSGGIGPEDAGAILSLKHPRMAGIDVNSRFEVSAAMKDVEKLNTFVETIRRYEQDK